MGIFQQLLEFFKAILGFLKNLLQGSINLIMMLRDLPSLLNNWQAYVPTFVFTGISACVMITIFLVIFGRKS